MRPGGGTRQVHHEEVMKYTKEQLKEINKNHDSKLDLTNSKVKRDREISKKLGFSRIGHNNV